MINRVPKRIADLRIKAGEMAAGAAQYETTIPLLQNKETNIQGELQPFVEKVVAVEQAKTELNSRRRAVRAAVAAARAFLTEGRNRIRPDLGDNYNPNWDITGLVGSLIIPKASADVLAVLGSFKDFLAKNPAFAIPGKNITAAQAGALFTTLEAARVALNLQTQSVDELQADRNAKAKILRKRMSDMIAELKMRLQPLDSRWLAFGLNKPGAVSTPAVPTDVKVTQLSPTAAGVEWTQSERARYYRVWIRSAAPDPWRTIGNPADLDFTIEELQRHPKTEVAISAVNDGGESALSEIVTVVLQT